MMSCQRCDPCGSERIRQIQIKSCAKHNVITYPSRWLLPENSALISKSCQIKATKRSLVHLTLWPKSIHHLGSDDAPTTVLVRNSICGRTHDLPRHATHCRQTSC